MGGGGGGAGAPPSIDQRGMVLFSLPNTRQ
jgi:hypothetical protein